ncbi:MAG: hypothetical protein PHX34_04810 [Candidatus Shapirobacteria bacterium]|nr:hypothetical protein [Candidatus Shapirobacteria bacterium]
MTQRNKILVWFGIIYVIFALFIYFGLKINLKNKFSETKLKETISGKSVFRDTTTDLCKYQIIGDPKEIGNYVKIEIHCNNGKKASSTLSLSAIEDKTVAGFLKEYARIIGFEEKLFKEENFVCYLDGKLLTDQMMSENIRPTSTINCSDIKEL